MSDPQSSETSYANEKESFQYQKLRQLLIGPEQRQLADILKRLDDPLGRARDLEKVLPDAIAVGRTRNKRLTQALQPIIDIALKSSVSKNPKVVADAIYPALGPAIRKAVRSALAGMIQSLNLILNQSFSWQGLKWRVEALRCRKSFAEVVLLHTLVYRVEQIFLIHRSSGLLLQHVVAADIESKDPDLVSGMLTAIQDFVKDSFDAETGEILDTLRMDGDHRIWIENGPDMILAAVIRGMPPVQLRARFRELLDEINRLYSGEIAEFDGQTAVFEIIRPDLEEALIFQTRDQERSISPVFWLLMITGIFITAWWGWRTYQTHQLWMKLVSQLRHQPGYMLVSATKDNGRYWLSGFQDPLAERIEKILEHSGLNIEQIDGQWHTFYAMDDAFVLQRAKLILRPPTTVQFKLSHQVLTVHGNASHQWINQFHSHVGVIPGILSYDDSGLTDSEMKVLQAMMSTLEQKRIYFEHGKAQLNENQLQPLTEALKLIKKIEGLNASMKMMTEIVVIGQTDPSGRPDFNLELSQKRAQAVMHYLVQNDIDPLVLHAVGATVGSPESRTDPRYRSVIFKTRIGAD